ncbi:MAG: hypothetical protein AAFY66_06695 [Pseudomonadota bacterium]
MAAFPEFPGVCEEAEGEFEHLLEGMLRLAHQLGFLHKNFLLHLERIYLLLISGDDGRALGLDDPIHEPIDLRSDALQFALDRERLGLGLFGALIPSTAEHHLDEIEELL